MSRYFEYFPNVVHTNADIANITLRTKIVDYVRANPKVFLPYVVNEDMRPEEVSYHYYGSVDYTWLLFLANDIIDPYYDWVMSDDNLNKYIVKKYYDSALTHYKKANTSIQAISDLQVMSWVSNETITDNIIEYRHKTDENLNISIEAYQFLANNTITAPTSNGVVSDCHIEAPKETFWNTNILVPYNANLNIASEWEPLRIYYAEIERNENRRHINVIDRAYTTQILNEFKGLMNE